MKKNLRTAQRNISKLARQGDKISNTGSKATLVDQPNALKSI